MESFLCTSQLCESWLFIPEGGFDLSACTYLLNNWYISWMDLLNADIIFLPLAPESMIQSA